MAGGKLFTLIDQIHDPVLNTRLTQDVENKLEYMGECSQGRLSKGVIAEVESDSYVVHELLAQLGLWK